AHLSRPSERRQGKRPTRRLATGRHQGANGPGSREDLSVVERQWWRLVEEMPANLGGVVAGHGRELGRIHPTQECDADGPAARIAARIAERLQLGQALDLQAGFFLKLAAGRGLERLVLIDEPARQRPAAGERLILAA